jgi:hypothetical protein
MSWYNETHREAKNRKARFRARLLKNHTRIKIKKQKTPKQMLASNRALRFQLKKAAAQLEFIQYLNTPTVPLSHNETNNLHAGIF